MPYRFVAGVFMVGFLLLAWKVGETCAQDDLFQQVDTGLHVGRFISPIPSSSGDSTILVIRINPAHYAFRLLNARELEKKGMTVREWCKTHDLIGGINAGMFQADYLTHAGYMKNSGRVHNAGISSSYMSALAFDPAVPNVDEIRIFDLDETGLSDIAEQYHTVIQNLRLIKRPRENKWSQQKKTWSEAALGQDKDGNVLFIFSRSPYSMHDLNTILLALPINIVTAQHLEGGGQASFYFSHKGIEIEERGCIQQDCSTDALEGVWRIPNILGFYRKKNDQGRVP
jgi:exopolysaccharide biosynthesis protein